MRQLQISYTGFKGKCHWLWSCFFLSFGPSGWFHFTHFKWICINIRRIARTHAFTPCAPMVIDHRLLTIFHWTIHFPNGDIYCIECMPISEQANENKTSVFHCNWILNYVNENGVLDWISTFGFTKWTRSKCGHSHSQSNGFSSSFSYSFSHSFYFPLAFLRFFQISNFGFQISDFGLRIHIQIPWNQTV